MATRPLSSSVQKRESVSPFLDPTTKPLKLVSTKIFSITKVAILETQSDSRNLIWSDVPSSLPTIRRGGTPSATETRMVPVTLAIDTEGVPITASTRVRSSAYLLSRDRASSSVIFMACNRGEVGLCRLLLLCLNLRPACFLSSRHLPATRGRDYVLSFLAD